MPSVGEVWIFSGITQCCIVGLLPDRESLPEAGTNFSKQEACPGSVGQEEGVEICEEHWSGIQDSQRGTVFNLTKHLSPIITFIRKKGSVVLNLVFWSCLLFVSWQIMICPSRFAHVHEMMKICACKDFLEQAFGQGAGEKLKLCGIWGANCAGKKAIVRGIVRDCIIL